MMLPNQANELFLHIRATEILQVEGTPRCFLGHVLSESPGKPEGIFGEWHWNGQEVVVHNDRYGLQPLFYYVKAQEFGIAPSLVTLLQQGGPRELDWQALAVFFRLGFFLGDDTPFQGIKTVPPNAVLRWSSAGLKVGGNPPKVSIAPSLERSQALRTYQDLFAKAVRRRLPNSPFGMLLSGGRDSRHILFELCRQGKKPDLVATVNRPNNTDDRVSSLLVRELGLNHLLVPATAPSLAGEIRRNQETHFCSDEHGWICSLRDSLQGKVALLFDGLGGDVLSAGLFLNRHVLQLMRAGEFVQLARALVAEENLGKYIAKLFLPEVGPLEEEPAIARIAAALELHADAPNPIGSFFFWNRTRREIALSPLSIFRMFRVHVPFLDYELFDFLASLPAEFFLDHTFHDQTIALGFPQWANFPYAEKRKSSVSCRDMAFAWQALHWLCRHQPPGLNLRFLMPRLLRAGLDPFYNRKAIGYLTTLPIYWTLLNEISK